MANFEKAHKFVSRSEGGYTDDRDDRGNWVDGKLVGTNYGISAPVLKSFLGRTPTKREMEKLKYETALGIYKNKYWDKIGGDKIENDSVALLIYDSSVNQGVGAITNMVKSSLVKQNKSFKTFDNEGINNINKANSKKLFGEIWKERYNRYIKGQKKYVKGWIKRIKEIEFKPQQKKLGVFILLGVFLIIGGYFIFKGLKNK